MTNPLEPRLAAIERAIALLSAEVAKIRAELPAADVGDLTTAAHTTPDVLSPESGPSSPPPRATEAPPARPKRQSVAAAVSSAQFENLLGRYGMLAISVLTAVAAVGTFLKWATDRHILTFGPAARVSLGVAFSAVITLWGLRLRRTERSFGSSMVGLGLVIGMVCAYAAGPSFHLVPTVAAFLGIAAVSWLLAIFAHSQNDEPLWCVAFGGAALAPFVTSDGGGSVYTLTAYGLLVLLPACFAISHRKWIIAWRVFYLASLLLIGGVAFTAHTSQTLGYVVALLFPFVVAAAGIVPFAPNSVKRGALRWLGLLAALTTLAENTTLDPKWLVATASVGSIAVWLILLDRHANVVQSSILERQNASAAVFDWIDAAFIPLLLATPPAIAFVWRGEAILPYSLASLVAAVFAWRRSVGSLRDASAVTTMLFATATMSALELENPTGSIGALIVLSWIAFVLHRARPSLSWLATADVLLAICGAWSAVTILDRRAYLFTPFGTEASLTAVVVLVGLIVPARFASVLRESTIEASNGRGRDLDAGLLKLSDRFTAFAPWVWGFAWVVMELSMAFSPTTSTLLLVIWYALTAVACVGTGRAKAQSRLRQLGLALALVTVATAFYGASEYFDTGARIAGYLVTSAFLLGIAYWYRRPGTAAEEKVNAATSPTAAPNHGGSR